MRKKLVFVLLLLLCLQLAYGQFTFIPQISVIRQVKQPQPSPLSSPKAVYKPQPAPKAKSLPQKSIVTPKPNSPKTKINPKAKAIVSPVTKLGKKSDKPASCFILKLDWACREGTPFESCGGSIIWNGKYVKSIKPSDYAIHNTTWPVKAKIGKNSLQFRGEGISDTFGLSIDNVKLIRRGTNNSIVVNGDFEQPPTKDGFQFFTNITGWQSDEIEIGNGKVYNSQWKSQVCELDGNRNDLISQYFYLDCNFKLIDKSKCACGNQAACPPPK